MADKIFSNAKDDVLGNAGKFAGLNDVEYDRDNSEQKACKQHRSDIKDRYLPGGRYDRIERMDNQAGLVE